MGWLISMFTGSAGGYLISASVAALLAASAAVYGTHEIDQIALSRAQAATATLQSKYDGYKQDVATKAAQADAKALADKAAQDARTNALQAQLIQAQKDANAKSDQLKAILNKAAPGDLRPIGPVAAQYYGGLRGQAAAGHPANPGNP
jgi:hypothetical protein